MSYTFREILPYYKRNLKVAFPVMLTQFGAAMVGLADSIMVGHYGTADLAAVSFSNAIFFTVMVFAMGAVMGITPLVGHVHGRLEKLLQQGTTDEEIDHKHAQISSYLSNGLVFTFLMCLASLLLLAPCIPYLDDFGQEPEVIACARLYYILIVLSIVPFLLFCFCKQFLEGLGNTLVAMLITLGCNLLNILLNWVFIFGHWGFEPMGAEGAGWATLIARLLMPLFFLVAMLWKADWRRYILSVSRRLITRREIEHLLAIGTPIGLQSFAEAFLFTASFVIIGWISKEALAAHHVANQMCDLTFMLAQGIGAATTIRVSHQLGKGDLHAVRMASTASIHLCLLMNTIGAFLPLSDTLYLHRRPRGGGYRFYLAGDRSALPVRGRLAMYRSRYAARNPGRTRTHAHRPLRLYSRRFATGDILNILLPPSLQGGAGGRLPWAARPLVGVRHRSGDPGRPLPHTV